MSDQEFEGAVVDWIEDGSDRTPRRAIDGVLLAIKTTPQERDLRIPWRLPFMTAIPRATGIAAVAIVAVVSVGAFAFLNNRAAVGPGASPSAPPATQTPTTAPTTAPTAEPSAEPGRSGWVPYTSAVYGITVDHPEGWDAHPATREWQEGDTPEQAREFSDEFGSETDDIAFGVLRVPAEDGADLATIDGLKAFAVAYCDSQGHTDCDTSAARTMELCADAGDPCRPAIILKSANTNPAEEGTYAFVPEASGTSVIVATVYRGEGWPGSTRFGGSSGLLLSALSPLGVMPAPVDGALLPIEQWTPFTSVVYGYTLAYPPDWDASAAGVEFQPGLDTGTTETNTDLFGSPDNNLGIGVLAIPVGRDAGIDTEQGLTAVADTFCRDASLPDCATFTDRVEPMCLDDGSGGCRPAILVRSDGSDPEDDGEYILFPGADGEVIVATIFRGDAFEGAAKYGGAVQLLKNLVSTMGVTEP